MAIEETAGSACGLWGSPQVSDLLSFSALCADDISPCYPGPERGGRRDMVTRV